jgi:CRISPR-associated protein Csh2
MTNADMPPNKEILLYYESRQNPNGDPGFENQPRLMPDDTIIVTDVRIKRTIRDYAKDKLGKTLFVDFGADGLPVTADGRAKEIIGDLKGKDILKELIVDTFDTVLFGALVTKRSEDESEKGGSNKLTGPIQFGLARSVNEVKIINPLISGRFIGDAKKGRETTFGKFYSVEYALIKVHGGITPRNLGKYLEDKAVMKAFKENEAELFNCLWNGTNGLVTRSKFPQRSVLYIEISYLSTMYNDLPNLVTEEKMKGKATELAASPFNFDRFVKVMNSRAGQVQKIKIAYCEELAQDIENLVKHLPRGKVELVKC